MYSIAAILVLLFAGVLIDRLGTRKASIIFSVLVFAGAAIVWQAKSIPLMFVGRFIFGAGDKIVFKDVKEFKPTFWYVTFLCLTFYAAVFPFQSLSTDFFHTKWSIALSAPSSGSFLAQVFNNFLHITSTAGGITSIIIFASMILAPFAGRLVDRVGKRTTFMVAGALLLIPCHLAMGLTRIYPVYPMILLGFSFVLVPAALWPSVPLIVKSNRVGTAFGLMTAIQNIGLGLFPLLNGLLRDKTGSYVASEVMFASLGIVGFIFAMLLKRADRREGHVLDAGPKP